MGENKDIKQIVTQTLARLDAMAEAGDHVYSLECPGCHREVWVNNGDISDLTRPDVEAVHLYDERGHKTEAEARH